MAQKPRISLQRAEKLRSAIQPCFCIAAKYDHSYVPHMLLLLLLESSARRQSVFHSSHSLPHQILDILRSDAGKIDRHGLHFVQSKQRCTTATLIAGRRRLAHARKGFHRNALMVRSGPQQSTGSHHGCCDCHETGHVPLDGPSSSPPPFARFLFVARNDNTRTRWIDDNDIVQFPPLL